MRKKDIMELGVTVILIFVLVIATINTLKLRKRAGAPKRPAVNIPVAASHAPAAPQAPASTDDLFEVMDKEARKYDLKKDPFTASPTASMGTKSGLSLTGIIWDKDNPMAIVNAEVVKVGDVIGDSKVIAIKKDRVVLRSEKGDIELVWQ